MKKVILIAGIFLLSLDINAQFNTITKETKPYYIILEKEQQNEAVTSEDEINEDEEIEEDIYLYKSDDIIKENNYLDDTEIFRLIRKRPPRTKVNIPERKLTHSGNRLQGLSIEALYQEILKNNIQHPKIVLAQAILETGWFKSSVCRNKGNLFGLTNPKTKTYYEFDDWRDSVKAYYTKVQYRYKGGNYLMWLKKIGYAEDPKYVSSLIKILKQYFF